MRTRISRQRLHGSGRIRNRSPICTALPVYMEPCTVRSLFFKCLHGTGQIKILSLSQCIMVVEGSRYVPAVFRRNVRREVEPLFFFANEYFTLLSR